MVEPARKLERSSQLGSSAAAANAAAWQSAQGLLAANAWRAALGLLASFSPALRLGCLLCGWVRERSEKQQPAKQSVQQCFAIWQQRLPRLNARPAAGVRRQRVGARRICLGEPVACQRALFRTRALCHGGVRAAQCGARDTLRLRCAGPSATHELAAGRRPVHPGLGRQAGRSMGLRAHARMCARCAPVARAGVGCGHHAHLRVAPSHPAGPAPRGRAVNCSGSGDRRLSSAFAQQQIFSSMGSPETDCLASEWAH